MSDFPTREEFREWLVAKEPDEYVGEARLPYGCPLSKFLRNDLGLVGVVPVGRGHGYYYDLELGDGPDTHALPVWADDFGRRIDEGRGNVRDRIVTAKQALTILDDLDVA